MAVNKYENLIVRFAQMFNSKRLEEKTVKKALLLLCEEFVFDSALLYEVDKYNNNLHLVEDVGTHSAEKEFSMELLTKELYDRLTEEAMIYCHGNEAEDSEEMKLLSLVGARAAVAFSSADETGRIYSLIILCNVTEKKMLGQSTYKNLEVALSIIASNTAIRVYQERLVFAQTALENVLDNTGIDIYVNDFNNHDILYVNESMARPYGGKKQFEGRKCWKVLFPGQTGPCEFCPQSKLIDEKGKPSKVYTWDYQRSFDGSWFRVFSAAFRWVDGRLAHVVSSADITDNKLNEELISYMANYDSLTNLPNRRMLVSACEKRISRTVDKRAYILFFDIDGFKNVNDTLGHESGDEFLIKLGEFFNKIPLLKGSIYRNGGDEFVALLGEDITEDNVRNLSRFINIRFEKAWELKAGKVTCGISIGVAQYPEDGLTAEELLHKADEAMYHVKKQGGGGVHFANASANEQE